MSSVYGDAIKVSIFGQSHSEAIGVVIDGLPAGKKIDMQKVRTFMQRRAPGNDAVSTTRKEADEPVILSGLVDDVTCGAPLCAMIQNTNTRSKDYDKLRAIPRPAHSDYPAFVKHNGANDIRGGGHFSGRLTAPLCFAGAVCMQLLEEKGIFIGAHIASIADVKDDNFDAVKFDKSVVQNLRQKRYPVLNDDIWQKMEQKVVSLRQEQDSAGGIIECGVAHLPVGLGAPLFGGVENRIAQAVFAVPAVKGIEFGAGFAVSTMTGSQNNDAFTMQNNTVKTLSNNHGGILGGLTSGMPVIFRAAFKPTPSIAQEQQSVNLQSMQNCPLVIEGRHDPCVVLRAVPAVEAACALAIYDMMMAEGRL